MCGKKGGGNVGGFVLRTVGDGLASQELHHLFPAVEDGGVIVGDPLLSIQRLCRSVGCSIHY